jgi:hypothetical protein
VFSFTESVSADLFAAQADDSVPDERAQINRYNRFS